MNRNQSVECATIALWDTANGLLLKSYEKLDAYTRNGALEIARETVRSMRDSPNGFFVGTINLRRTSKEIRFEDDGSNDPVQLKVLLCRAFGYKDLVGCAVDIVDGNPMIHFGDQCLGFLESILEQGRNRTLLVRFVVRHSLN